MNDGIIAQHHSYDIAMNRKKELIIVRAGNIEIF